MRLPWLRLLALLCLLGVAPALAPSAAKALMLLLGFLLIFKPEALMFG